MGGVLRSDLPNVYKQSDALTNLFFGSQQKQKEAQAQANIDVNKAQQMVPINAQATGANQSATNAANMQAIGQLQQNAPEGAQIHAGDLSTGVDPYARMVLQNQKQGASAIQSAQKQYMSGLPKIQQQLSASQELSDVANDPKNVGSIGQARTLMLKSMGMSRYNEQEAKAVMPPSLQSAVTGMFNQAGGDDTPLNAAQQRAINTFSQHMAANANNSHEQLKQNVMTGYQMSPYYDPSRGQQMQQQLGQPFSQAYGDFTKKSQQVSNSATPPAQQPAPQGSVDKLYNLIRGGGQGAPAPAPQPQPAPQGSPPPGGNFSVTAAPPAGGGMMDAVRAEMARRAAKGGQ